MNINNPTHQNCKKNCFWEKSFGSEWLTMVWIGSSNQQATTTRPEISEGPRHGLQQQRPSVHSRKKISLRNHDGSKFGGVKVCFTQVAGADAVSFATVQ